MLQDDNRIQLELISVLKVEKILFGDAPLKYERDGRTVFVDFPQQLSKGKTYSIDFYYSGNPVETGRFGGITFKKDAAGFTWINTACEGQGASVWWPNKDQWRDEVENMQISVAKTLEVAPEKVELQYVGLNHLSWARVLVDGRDVTREVLETQWGSSGGYVSTDFVNALGLLPNYYIRYYAHPDDVLHEQLTAEETRAEYLQQVEAELLEMYADPQLKEKPKLRKRFLPRRSPK